MRKAGEKQNSRLIMVLCLVLLCSLLRMGFAETNRRILVGCFPLNGFYEIASDGKVTGYGAEYTEAVAEQAGWKYSYVPFSSWVEALAALERNEIDLLAPAQRTKERVGRYNFSAFPLATEYGALLTLDKKTNLIYEDFQTFNGMKVGCVGTFAFLPAYKGYEENNNFAAQIKYYYDTPALFAALEIGEVDAVVANLMTKTDQMKLLARFGAAPVYYLLSARGASLQGELNRAIDKLAADYPTFQRDLEKSYFGNFTSLPFSKRELDFIAQAPVLKVAVPGGHPPYSYELDGKVAGVDIDILQRISKISGLKFSYVMMPPGAASEEFAATHGVAIVSGEISHSDEHKTLHNGNYSSAYMLIERYFLGKNNGELQKGSKRIVGAIDVTEDLQKRWKQIYPSFRFVNYTTVAEAVEALQGGNVDVLLGERFALQNILNVPKNKNLNFLTARALEENLSFRVFASSKDGNTAILTSILNKSVGQISTADKNKFISDNVARTSYKYSWQDFLYQYSWQLFLFVLLVIALGVAVYFVYRARRVTELIVAENEMKLRHITNNIRVGVIVLKANQGMVITYANDGFLELIGITREKLEESDGSYLTYVYKDDLPLLQETILSDEQEVSLELRVLKADNTYVPVLFNCTTGYKNDGEKELYCVVMDMTEQNKLLERLRIENRRTELILDRMEEIFYEINFQDGSILTSQSFLETLGWTFPAIFALGDNDFAGMWQVRPEDNSKLNVALNKLRENRENATVLVKLKSLVEKAYVWCEVSQYPILSNDGHVIEVIGLIRNVNEQMLERERLQEQAKRDALTGLYNKEAFEELAREALEQMPEQNHALVFIDLDNFKSVNDTLGHLVGDRAICEAADKIKVIFSNYDIVARFGGDEFCVFVKNIPEETLLGKVEWLISKMRATYTDDKSLVKVTCSSGIACTDKYGYEYPILMQKADQALYAAKKQGRDRFIFS